MSVGIFQNGEYNKVAGNAKDSTAANTTYNNGTSGLQANNVQSAIDELNSNLNSKVGNMFINSDIITSLTVLDTGIYLINNFNNGITDAPAGGFGMIIVSKVNSAYIYQAYISYANGIYIRNCENSNWNNWKLITFS